MRESALEQVFFRKVREAGGIAIKLMPTHAGVPDRLVLFPGGRAYLVELKTETGQPSVIQRLWHSQAEALGHHVVVLHGREQVVEWIRETK